METFALEKNKTENVLFSTYFTATCIKDNQKAIRKYNKIIAELESKSVYESLEISEKLRIQNTIIAFLQTRLYPYPQIVAFVVKLINNKKHQNKDIRTS